MREDYRTDKASGGSGKWARWAASQFQLVHVAGHLLAGLVFLPEAPNLGLVCRRVGSVCADNSDEAIRRLAVLRCRLVRHHCHFRRRLCRRYPRAGQVLCAPSGDAL